MRLDQTAAMPLPHDDLFFSRESDSSWPTPLLGIGLIILAVMVSLALPIVSRADDAPATVAATRSELKEWLEKSKQSKPRLPLPPPTEEEIAAAKTKSRSGGGAPGLGGIVNNGRMRQLYLPTELRGGGFTREPDPALTLSSAFKTELFWVVSRGNNCAYCQGHQEVKLAAEGLSEETIAALDGDWTEFTPAERAAFALARKLTLDPQTVGDDDIDRLRAHYQDVQIVEILLTIAANNAMNRWTGGLAIPQEGHRVFLSPTPPKFQNLRSRVAPLDPDATGPACARPSRLGPLESREQAEAALAAARGRTPRLPLAGEAEARATLVDRWPSGSIPQWARLLLNFPKAGPPRVTMHLAAIEKGRLSPRLKAQIDWIAARNDRAWYALGHARRRLLDLGQPEAVIWSLDQPGDTSAPAERAAFAVARKLTVDPALITDGDIEGLRQQFSDQEVAEIVFQVSEAVFFDRLTEPARLRLEPESGAEELKAAP
jgi:alkylhydroperoxidase family enzyme